MLHLALAVTLGSPWQRHFTPLSIVDRQSIELKDAKSCSYRVADGLDMRFHAKDRTAIFQRTNAD
jgi:hypothetical protein